MAFSSNFRVFSFKILRNLGVKKPIYIRHSSNITNEDVRERRNALFDKEIERQKGLVTRVEKIEVEFEDPSFGCTMLMNKNISTPADCAKHINEMIINRSVIASVNGKLWDMHKPINESCKLKFLHFLEKNPMECNKAFWRSCSFMMGLILEKAFKDDYFIELHSWPKPNLLSGSFIYDVKLNIKNWMPKPEDLRVLTVMLWKLKKENLNFERLEIDEKLALKMFENNRFKLDQIPKIIKAWDKDSLIVYRVGDHIDISNGPMISRTGLLGYSKIASAHEIELSGENLVRFQGVALPSQIKLNPYAFDVLVERAKKLNDNGLLQQEVEAVV